MEFEKESNDKIFKIILRTHIIIELNNIITFIL